VLNIICSSINDDPSVKFVYNNSALPSSYLNLRWFIAKEISNINNV